MCGLSSFMRCLHESLFIYTFEYIYELDSRVAKVELE